MIAPWLQQLLEVKGAWNTDGVGRAARATYCRGCGCVVLRGLDANRAALTATVDPEPLNPLGEFLAVSAGRRTYDLQWRGRYELNPRESGHIRALPARVRGKSSVVVEHRCGSVMPTEGQSLIDDEKTKREVLSDAPF